MRIVQNNGSAEDKCLPGLLAEQVLRQLEATAVVDGEDSISYRELGGRSTELRCACGSSSWTWTTASACSSSRRPETVERPNLLGKNPNY